jgi:hypothetical protein
MYKVRLKEKNVINLSADVIAAHLDLQSETALQESRNTIQTCCIRRQGSESVGSNRVHVNGIVTFKMRHNYQMIVREISG